MLSRVAIIFLLVISFVFVSFSSTHKNIFDPSKDSVELSEVYDFDRESGLDLELSTRLINYEITHKEKKIYSFAVEAKHFSLLNTYKYLNSDLSPPVTLSI